MGGQCNDYENLYKEKLFRKMFAYQCYWRWPHIIIEVTKEHSCYLLLDAGNYSFLGFFKKFVVILVPLLNFVYNLVSEAYLPQLVFLVD